MTLHPELGKPERGDMVSCIQASLRVPVQVPEKPGEDAGRFPAQHQGAGEASWEGSAGQESSQQFPLPLLLDP